MNAPSRQAAIELSRQAQRAMESGRLDQAHDNSIAVVDALERRLAELDENPEALRDLSVSLERLGNVERNRGQLDSAYARYEKALQILQKVLAQTGETPEALRDLGRGLGRLGDVEQAHCLLDAAYARYEQALQIARKVLAQSGETPEALRDLSVSLERLGDVERRRGQLDAATARYEQAQQIDRKVLALTGETPEALRDLSVSLERLGDVERKRGQLDAATVRYEQALQIRQKILAQTGETLEALRNLSVILGRLGDVELAHGQLDAAYTRYEHALQIDRKVLAQTGETPEALRDLSVSLDSLGNVERKRGQLDTAYARHEQAMQIRQRVLAQTGERPEALRDLSLSLARLGGVELKRGQLDAAYARYEQALHVARQVLARTGETPEALRDRSFGLLRLGVVEHARGQLDAAYVRYEQALQIACKVLAQSGETPEALCDLSLSLEQLGDVEQASGQLDGAHARYEQALQIARKVLAQRGETPEALRGLSSILGRLGNVDRARGQLDAAYARYEQALQIRQRVVAQIGETPETQRDLIVSLDRLGEVQQARGQFDAATVRYEQALQVARKVLAQTGETPEALHDMSVSLGRLGDLELARGHCPVALTMWQQGVEALLRVNTQLASWPGDAFANARRLVAAVRADALPVIEALAQRDRLWSGLAEHLDLNDLEVVERAQADVARFHALWLELTLERAPDRLPEVLGAMQGRKIAALVLEELEQQRGPGGHVGNAALRQRYLALRAELRRLALGLRVVSGGLGAKREDPDAIRHSVTSGEDAVPFNAKVWRARQAEYHAALAEYRRCRAELAREPGFEALAVPQMETADLQAGLAEGHALLILVQPDASPGSARVQAHALVLNRSGHQHQPLPDLGRAVVALRDLGRHEAAIAGKRYVVWRDVGAAGAAQAPERLDAPAPAPDLGHALWTPLAPHLQGIHTLHVVTHGELHLLALQDGAPTGLEVCHHPGLVFYWLQRRRAAAAEPATPPTAALDDGADATLALQAYSPADGEDLPPIPFVHAEAHALQALWQQVQPIEPDRPVQVALLHLAGHGQAEQGHDAGVLVGPGQTLGLHEVLRSGLKADIVYLSACVVGRTIEVDGEPLGMVSALFLRGARQIVASLAPVSDFVAPLLAILFHLALKAQPGGRLDAHRALHEAKAQLRSGEWPAPAEDLVRQAYLPTVQRAIEDVLAQGATGALEPPNEVGRLMAQWLVPASDFFDVHAAEHGPVAAVFARGGGAEAGAKAALDLLVSNRHRLHLQPGVQTLLRYVGVFGAPGPAR